MYFNLHNHSEYSCLDAIPKVSEYVQKAIKYQQPAVGISDHGFMSGCIQLYQECKKNDLKSFPGLEAYLVKDLDKTSKRYHITLFALNFEGYKTLCKLSSLSHTRDRFHRKPRICLQDFAELAQENKTKDIALLTGCHFGLIIQELIEHGEQSAKGYLKTYASWFPNMFIELQHHNICEKNRLSDTEVVEWLYQTSKELSLPVLITQDCHYSNLNDKPVHEIMKKMTIHVEDLDDAVFPGDSFHFASTNWVRNDYPEQIWNEADYGFEHIYKLSKLALPVLDNYKFSVPKVGKDAKGLLRQKCIEALDKIYTEIKPLYKFYKKRLEYELEVINEKSMADYFLLVQRICEFCTRNNILVNARGSANGSLVCYFLNITNLNPIVWNLSFDRFLSKDREKPPDIDLDIEDSSRLKVAEWLKQNWNAKQIGTFSTLGIDDKGSGSIFVQYMAMKRRSLPEEVFKQKFSSLETIQDISYVEPEDAKLLNKLAEKKPRKAPGAHAAGFVLSADDKNLEDYIPSMLIPSSNSTVTQMQMDDVEACGFVKVDLLGQRTLSGIKRCLELIGKDPKQGLAWIPLTDSKVFKYLACGLPNCNGLFQFEGWTSAKGAREVNVKSIEDCIAVLSLYRPATLHSGYTQKYLDCKRGITKVSYSHKIFEKHLKKSYGIVFIQDQIIDIVKDVGFSNIEVNDILQAIKVKHSKAGHSQKSDGLFEKNRLSFLQKCRETLKLTQEQSEEAWNIIVGFAGYGFNLAHATAYAILGYQTAYLKYYWPIEFMSALLETTAGTPKESKYIQEAKRLGIKLLSPDINESKLNLNLTTERNLRKGLLTIKGIGQTGAENIIEFQPYDSVEDFCNKVSSRAITGTKDYPRTKEFKGKLKVLKEAGALGSFGVKTYE